MSTSVHLFWTGKPILLAQLSCLLFLASCSMPAGEVPMPAGLPTPTAAAIPNPVTAGDETQPDLSPTPPPSAHVPREGLYLAQPGNPIDVTVPDGTPLRPGEPFTKTWRLVNVGLESWTPEFALVWFSGDTMSLYKEQSLRVVVAPGEALELSVEMIAPEKPGSYQSNWKLRAADGTLFGLGPHGNSPFWAKIQVEDIGMASAAAASPTPQATTVINGYIRLNPSDELDFDGVEPVADAMTDVKFVVDGDSGAQLSPVNGARISIFGSRIPTYDECVSSLLFADSIGLVLSDAPAYICFYTDQKIPGYASLDLSQIDVNVLVLTYATWDIP
ncbi:NBR1-Ig-like domain-containing protein [Ornatilinea apprima]|nr:NBR1-Ig-like domain-containing protein [Ornatilinea apprima]